MAKSIFGIIGLGVMGRSLAKNIIHKGFTLSVYNRITPKEKYVVSDFLKKVNNNNIQGFLNLKDFVSSLTQPRKILLMVKSGTVVDTVIDQLKPLLAPGDIIIDGGNSHYQDTQRRVKALEKEQLHFLGVGISGGEEGALKGPSIMAGGSSEQYELVQPIFEAIAAKDKNGDACAAFLGTDGCGHFVKTIHNGIEYAEMQLLAECYSLLSSKYSYPEISEIFSTWNEGALNSYLLSITSKILIKKEGEDYLLDKVLDQAGNKGTGSWSSQTAFQLGVPASMINAAVTARYISALKEKRAQLSKGISKNETGSSINVSTLKKAYTFARIINHHQGFEIIRAVAKANQWNINFSELARIWTQGCIIKSQFMESLVDVFKSEQSILENADFFSQLEQFESSVAQTLQYSLLNRIPMSCFSNSYSYFVSMTTDRLSANLIQAQRDEFGAHTYQRADQPNQSFTSKWTVNE